MKVVPCPSTLETESVPPIATTNRFEMARPSPVPPYRRLVPTSTWLNSWNSRAEALLGNADAGVGHLEEQRTRGKPLVGGSDSGTDGHLALRGELHGVGHEVRQHLAQPEWISDELHRSCVELHGHGEALRLGDSPVEGAHVAHELLDVAQPRLELEPPRLHLGEVEDVIEHREQRVSRAANGLHRRPVHQPDLATQRLGKADDAHEGRADLVAHHRQVAGLGLVRGVRCVARTAELLFRSGLLRDVPIHTEHPHRTSSLVVLHLSTGEDVALALGGVERAIAGTERLLAGDGGDELAPEPAAIAGVDAPDVGRANVRLARENRRRATR